MIDCKDILLILLNYAIGCVCAGYYLALLWGSCDIRKFGSGSAGARNVGRKFGPAAFAVTFLIDCLKGAVAVYCASKFSLHHWVMFASLIAVISGHIWPAQLGFKGGKGVTVTLGGIFVFDYRLAVVCLIIFFLCLFIFHKHTLGGLISIIALPVSSIIFQHRIADIIGFLVVTLLILFAHRNNIKELNFSQNVENKASGEGGP